MQSIIILKRAFLNMEFTLKSLEHKSNKDMSTVQSLYNTPRYNKDLDTMHTVMSIQLEFYIFMESSNSQIFSKTLERILKALKCN